MLGVLKALVVGTLEALVVRALEDWDIVTAQTVLEEQQHQAWLLEHGWELVAVVCCHLTEHTEEAGPHLTNCCQNILTTLAERVTSPKEVSSANCLAVVTWQYIAPAPMLSCYPALLSCFRVGQLVDS